MIYLFTGSILVCFALFCACEPCIERYCYKNSRKVIPSQTL